MKMWKIAILVTIKAVLPLFIILAAADFSPAPVTYCGPIIRYDTPPQTVLSYRSQGYEYSIVWKGDGVFVKKVEKLDGYVYVKSHDKEEGQK